MRAPRAAPGAERRWADRLRRSAAGAVLRLLPAAPAALLVVAGCARGPRVPPAPAGYARSVDDALLAEGASLAGRRIVIDPGHGGAFRGALGASGLSEAEVNLGVALILRQRLEAAGAEVLLTRADDRDFLSPSDSALRSDLGARVAMSEAFDPDAFVSIHHNADAGGRHDVNETITFYKLGDDGPSLELAQDVHRALVRHVGIQPQRVVPGNFAVLRGSGAPAILTETSYITYPPTEARLRMPQAQRIEAEALFVGLARYFERPVPRIEEFTAIADAFSAGAGRPDTLPMFGDVTFHGRIAGTFDQLSLAVDGREIPLVRHRQDFTAVPDPPLPAGVHEAVLRAGLAGQGSARPARIRFDLRTCGRIGASVWRAPRPRRGETVPLRLEIRDEAGRLASGPDAVLEIRVLTPGVLTPAETTVALSRGVAWYYPRLRADLARAGAGRGAARPPRVRIRGSYPAPCAAAGAVDTIQVVLQTADSPDAWAGFVIEMPGDRPLRPSPAVAEGLGRGAWINRDGFAALDRMPQSHGIAGADTGGVPVPAGGAVDASLPTLPGYRLWSLDPAVPPRFTAIAGGALHGRRITLDPAGGGEAGEGTGPGGTRGSHLNLAVARALRGLLESAGAEVLLTRDGDYAVSEVDRVRRSEAFRAERFVRIGHAAEPPRIGYYFSSATGRAWAQRTGGILAALGLPAPGPAEDAQYPIQQTSCPALHAGLARVDLAAEEDRLLAPGTLRAEAYALYVSLAREWTDGAGWPLDSLEVRDARGRPVDGAPVTLGGALVLETDALGRARFLRTEPGPLELAVDDPRVRARVVLIDSARSPTLTGAPGR